MAHANIDTLTYQQRALPGLIEKALLDEQIGTSLGTITPQKLSRASVVLLVLSPWRSNDGRQPPAPCLILNKRSEKVRQAGDLCCPGGGLSWGRDKLLARMLMMPGSPLRRWRGWRFEPPDSRRILSLLLAVGLREAWEEMRLNPFRFNLLGVLPAQHLVMFDRVIYPMVGWAPMQPLKPNWEVDRIVPIPVTHLLDPGRYGRFRPLIHDDDPSNGRQLRLDDFPCFIHEDRLGAETLWGATYRIVLDFLHRVFAFEPPPIRNLPLIQRRLGHAYLNGSR